MSQTKEVKLLRLKNRRLTENEVITYKYIKANILHVYGKKCINCNSTNNLQLDHIVPVSIDPSKTFDIMNMQILCEECNSDKSNNNCDDYRTVEEVEKFVKYFSKNVDLSRISKMPFANPKKVLGIKKYAKKPKKVITRQKRKSKFKKEVAAIEHKKKIKHDTFKPTKRNSGEYGKLMTSKKSATVDQMAQINAMKGII